jgi:hypothetical protein
MARTRRLRIRIRCHVWAARTWPVAGGVPRGQEWHADATTQAISHTTCTVSLTSSEFGGTTGVGMGVASAAWSNAAL